MVDAIGIAVRDPHQPRRRALAYHATGLVAGSMTLALALLLLNGLTAGVRELSFIVPALGVLAGAWALGAIGLPGLWYPRRRWQVPERWRFVLPLEMTALGYGALLGLGVLTDVVLPAFWMAMLLSVLVASPSTVVGAWVVYAGARFSMLFVAAASPSPDLLNSRLVSKRSYVAAANSIVLAATSLVFISSIY